jgi:hypothetical protein
VYPAAFAISRRFFSSAAFFSAMLAGVRLENGDLKDEKPFELPDTSKEHGRTVRRRGVLNIVLG